MFELTSLDLLEPDDVLIEGATLTGVGASALSESRVVIRNHSLFLLSKVLVAQWGNSL